MDSSVDAFVEPLSHLSSDLGQIAARIKSLEKAYSERMDQWTAERQSLMKEIASLRAIADRRELSTEIAQTETALSALRNRLDAIADDPTVSPSKLLRATAREAELQAYLNGLRFKAGIPIPHADAMQEGDIVVVESATA
jgi:septal ring factor EnvC (AmiA/AmiB activator)